MTLPRGTLALAAALLFAVSLGTQEVSAARPTPDGAIRSFTGPCDPCGMDGGTGTEILFGAIVAPDADGMGDESQDPDGGGLGLDWEDDWFEDFEAGDELVGASLRGR
jgi:hypothetical protein